MFNIPIRLTKHFNKLNSKVDSVLKKSISISKKVITVFFESETPEKKSQGESLGIDVGIANIWSASDGISSHKNKDGWDLSRILHRLQIRKKGSKGFKRTQNHRTNYINWSVKKIFENKNLKEIVIEDIKDLRRGKSSDRFRSHWTYPQIFNRIEQISEELGVLVSRVNPRNTSRKCSSCGVIDVKSRKGKSFKCVSCGHKQDADSNAAINILCGSKKKKPHIEESTFPRVKEVFENNVGRTTKFSVKFECIGLQISHLS
jgi:IS605 OrfB family transposase